MALFGRLFGLCQDAQICRRHGLRQPDTVFREKKAEAVLLHMTCLNPEDERLPMPSPDSDRGLDVCRHMDIQAIARKQTLFENR